MFKSKDLLVSKMRNFRAAYHISVVGWCKAKGLAADQ